jgi:1,4-alpha-glucan branching enzyme
MGFGSFVLMLHSHLPYYRKHGMWPAGEESLYECIAETYLPLANALNELRDEGIQAKITLGITPILAEQLADEHMKQGFINFVNQRIMAAWQDVERYPDPEVPHSEHLAYLAKWYLNHYGSLLRDFTNKYNCDLIGAFKELQDAGCIEITTSGATHGFSPLLATDESVNLQFKAGVESYKRHFGRAPKGVWLPECAYRPERQDIGAHGEKTIRPGIDAFLYENDLQYFFTEYHAIEGGATTGFRRIIGIYGNIEYVPLPLRNQTGLNTYEAYWMKHFPVCVMGRNDRASYQVWSASDGYPGNGQYREFHKKDSQSGLHFWRLTSKDTDLGDKMLYNPDEAFEQTAPQADHYAALIYDLLKQQKEQSGQDGLLMVSFDTELFGHWWFEGVKWLKDVIKKLHAVEGIDVKTASSYLQDQPPQSDIDLPESTWGAGGHFHVWQNPDTEWMWPQIHAAEFRMRSLRAEYSAETDALKIRVLNQITRELLLLQSSDWPFLVTTVQAKDYAIERFEQHNERFWQLVSMLDTHHIDEAAFYLIEEEDNPFGPLSYQWFDYSPQAKLVTSL